MKHSVMAAIFATLLLSLVSPKSSAHQLSDAFLDVASTGSEQIALRWDVAIRDLEPVLNLDSDLDATITWGELKAGQPRLTELATQGITLSGCSPLQVQQLSVRQVQGTGYARIKLTAENCSPSTLPELRYQALFDWDPMHRVFVRFQQGSTVHTHVLSPDQPAVTLGAPSGSWAGFMQFVVEGIWHVWIGFDHILFLISLLLPCVIALRQTRPPNLGKAVWNVTGVVTAFTLAHSITLGLAMTQIVTLPGAWVESVIAISVVLAAMNNIFPVVTSRRWLLAAVFGLIHGFGFAGVLSELDLAGQSLLVSLGGFNVGVELGQLAIVLVFVPLAWAMRESWFYRIAVVRGGSAAIMVIGLMWATERITQVA